MLFEKTESPYSSIENPRTAETSSLRWELQRIICIFAAACLMLALVTYSPTDPSWTTWSTTKNEFHNWMGRMGSIMSDLLLQLFGLSAFLIPALPLSFVFRKRDPNLSFSRGRLGGAVVLVVSFAALLQGFYAKAWMPWHIHLPGGIIGDLSLGGLSYLAGAVGSRLFALGIFSASVVYVFRFPLLSFITKVLRTHFPNAVNWAWQKRESFGSISAFFTGLKEKWRDRKAKAAPIPEPAPAAIVHTPAPLPPPPTGAPVQTTMDESLTNEGAGPTIDEMVKPAPILHNIPKRRVQRSANRSFALPSLNLISGKAESKTKSVDKNWYIEKANILVQKLKDFGVEGEVVHISPGPVITVYEFKPASGVKIKEIANLSDDLTLALSVLSVRIVAPIPGKPVVGIEIPSPHREMVFFKDLIQETPFFKGELKIPIALGRLASGEPVSSDLASMPHLLIAGSTGTGKSVFINTMICSLLYRFSPDQLKLILVDPKMVELSHYEGIPHLLLPVVVDSKKAVMALRWAVDEMERRYTLMHHFGVRHIDMYNERLAEVQKGGKESEAVPLPYIVVVIDEYADLMAVVPKEVELSIARLAQKARASGIHLVLATQRPSTDVVTGTIKANFPSRISFRVASSIDSKTILDRTGSERLLGHGDLLFHSAGFNSLRRMQGPYLADQDLERIVSHLKAQGEPEYDENILAKYEEKDDDEGSERAPYEGDDEEGRLYDQAVRLVAEKGEASISLIQRHLRIGYNRAASLMEQMEKEGVVGASTGPAKRRSVLINP